jgi:hypothetical protein
MMQSSWLWLYADAAFAAGSLQQQNQHASWTCRAGTFHTTSSITKATVWFRAAACNHMPMQQLQF